MKTLKNIIFITLPAIFIALIFLEIFFRTIVPASDHPRGFWDEKEKMYSYSNKKEKGVNTIGRFAEIRAKWRINNMYWNYPIDYYPLHDRKLIAVIGDSYIEAFQVNVGENWPFLLKEKFKNDYEVYAFGKSGAPLSQYLHISRYVNKHFNPDILIFNLVHNDFDESILELYPNRNYFLQLSINKDDSIAETIPRPNDSFSQYKPIKRLIYRSALFRYLYFNLRVGKIIRNVVATNNNFEANVNINNVNRKNKIVKMSTNYLINTIRKENIDKRIVFVIDAPRYAIYENALDKSDILWINEMIDAICTKYKVECIDLTGFMKKDFEINRIKFNSDLDGHWNDYGHKFVANLLFEYLKNNPK